MSATIRIQDDATPELKRLMQQLPDSALQQVMGRAAANLTKRHLRGLALSRHRSHVAHNFYAAQRLQVAHAVEGERTYLLIARPLAHRYYGGTIRPKNAKALTLPARPEAEGRRAREFANTFTGRTKRGRGFIAQKDGKAIRILYWLVRSVTHEPDETVLPSVAELQAEMVRQGEAHISREHG